MSKNDQSSNNIMNEYIKLTKEYQEKYGKNTIVLLQVGAFFEVYGLKHPETNEITESQIEDFSQICQLTISDKKIIYKKQQIVMAGFRDYTLEKYLQKITDGGYTAVVYVQEKEGKVVTRKFYGVYSAGTFISYETDNSPQLTNNIMCVWFDTCKPLKRTNQLIAQKDSIIYGVATINIFTGESSIFEHNTNFIMNPTTFDELERYVSVYSPSELIIISPFDSKTIERILQYSGLKTNSIHYFNSDNNEQVLRCSKQKYINVIISSQFGEDAFNNCEEFKTNEIATQAFCFLLNFIKEHNPNLVRNITIPRFNNTSDKMILANHTLKQLNIIDDISLDSKKSGHLSSVHSFLNKCSTSMGKRLFQYQLLNPTTDSVWLNKEYSMIETILLENNVHFIELFRKKLIGIKDLEKISRQLVTKRIYPSSIYQIYNSVSIIKQLNICLFENKNITDYLCNDILNKTYNSYDFIDSITSKLLNYLDSVFNINICKTTNSITSFEDNMILPGVSDKLDGFVKSFNDKKVIFNEVHSRLNQLFRNNALINTGLKTINLETEYIKIHETEKSGSTLQITKTRATTMKKIIKNILESNVEENKKIVIEYPYFEFQLSDIKFLNASGTTEEIDIPVLNKIIKEIMFSKEKMNEIIATTYYSILEKVEENFFKIIENLTEYISKLDVLTCKSYLAKYNNYCRPEIVENEKAYVNATDLRHCLIEHLQKNEIYVCNDISLGSNVDGILLYGTNAVGKTSLIRALGISIIMAQSGLYVPCKTFQYKPYSAIYSRILGSDNLFKGMSTFAVEMSELRVILKMADENSLILGDELCSGTETESALSIFVAGLMDLHNKRSSFIFATHFHEIIYYDEIKALQKLALKHMSVIYDRERDSLVYDRKLKEGPGTKTYGLEVCKSLYLSDDFLEKAYSIRNKYYPETKGELSHNSTIYNANKIKGICEICKECIAEEIHHLNQQKNANEDGFIGSFHKNHPANLLNICEKCHDKIHSHPDNKELKKMKTTKGYQLF
jgi:DNA mismatch repair protein MutS